MSALSGLGEICRVNPVERVKMLLKSCSWSIAGAVL